MFYSRADPGTTNSNNPSLVLISLISEILTRTKKNHDVIAACVRNWFALCKFETLSVNPPFLKKLLRLAENSKTKKLPVFNKKKKCLADAASALSVQKENSTI